MIGKEITSNKSLIAPVSWTDGSIMICQKLAKKSFIVAKCLSVARISLWDILVSMNYCACSRFNMADSIT